MAITRTDLKTRAAMELGVLVSGQTLEAEDAATIESLVDPLLAQLAADRVAFIDPDDIEPALFLPAARLLANEAAPSFSQQRSEQVRILNEQLIRRLSSPEITDEPAQVKFY